MNTLKVYFWTDDHIVERLYLLFHNISIKYKIYKVCLLDKTSSDALLTLEPSLD